MPRKKSKRQSDKATRASVRSEMAKPRVSSSARAAELGLNHDENAGQPSTTISGTVRKIIPSRRPGRPGAAQIVLDVTEKQYRDLRIENSLTDEHGSDVKLKKGAPVEVTVSARDDDAPD